MLAQQLTGLFVKDNKEQCQVCSQVVAVMADLLRNVATNTLRVAVAAQDM
jgi:hypothetical protein